MTDRPSRIMSWALENFGPFAASRVERAGRCVEEAIEIAQAEGLPLEALKRIADRVYSRPPGVLGQEIGGLMITIEALAENAGLSAEQEAQTEYERITSLPKSHWQRKHSEKVAAGTANLQPEVPPHAAARDEGAEADNGK